MQHLVPFVIFVIFVLFVMQLDFRSSDDCRLNRTRLSLCVLCALCGSLRRYAERVKNEATVRS